MSKYTAEQVDACILCYKSGDLNYCRQGIVDLLTDYAALLRERESAKEGVTDEMIERAARAMCRKFDPSSSLDEMATCDKWRRFADEARCCLEAVAPMLASVRVPDGWSIGETKVTGAQEIGVWLCDGKSLQVIHPGDSMAANLPFYLIKAMLAAASKPEAEE